jgi:hypothetical protein
MRSECTEIERDCCKISGNGSEEDSPSFCISAVRADGPFAIGPNLEGARALDDDQVRKPCCLSRVSKGSQHFCYAPSASFRLIFVI